MKFRNLLFLSVLLFLFLAFSLYMVHHQNGLWASQNGRVGFTYWVLNPFIWMKVSAFLLYGANYQFRIINNKPNDFYFAGLKLLGIKKRVIAQILDGLTYLLLWVCTLLMCTVIVLVLYKMGMVKVPLRQSGVFTRCLNYVGEAGAYIFAFVVLAYSIIMEYAQQSTFGKMMMNSGVISIQKKKPSFLAVLVKNLIRFVPVNDIFYYFRRITLSEYVSGIRTIELEEKTTDLYNNFIQNENS